jgi:hypothetical protein
LSQRIHTLLVRFAVFEYCAEVSFHWGGWIGLLGFAT